MEANTLYIFLVIFFASIVHTVTGFAFAIIAMPLISKAFGISFAAPFVAIGLVFINLFMLVHYRSKFNIRKMLPLVGIAFMGIPIGIWLLKNVDEKVSLMALGVIMVVYALYSMIAPDIPEVKSQVLGYALSFGSGCLAGAYNTPGPLMVIYGKLAAWPRFEFISNLQGFFLSTSLFVFFTHLVSGNINADVTSNIYIILVAVIAGLGVGLLLARLIPTQVFKKIILVMILLIGVRMFF